MKRFRFLEWKVYQDTKDLFSSLLKVVKKTPKRIPF